MEHKMKKVFIGVLAFCALVACGKQDESNALIENKEEGKSTTQRVLTKNETPLSAVVLKSEYVDYRPQPKQLDNAESETRQDTLVLSVDNPKVSHCNNEFIITVHKERLAENEQLITPILVATMLKAPIEVAVDADRCQLLTVVNAHELTPDKLDAVLDN